MEENKFESIEGIEHLENRYDIEKKTIEIAINEELKENRKVIIAPKKEHYDIISIGNSPKDIRYIEVKGHISKKKAGDIYLQEDEFKNAKRFGRKYWIYLVNIIQKNEEPIILKIRDPANRLKWKIIEKWVSRFKIHKKKLYFSHINGLLKNSIDKTPNLKTIPLKNKNTSKDKIRKITILPINKIRKIEIEDLKALSNINNISKKEENKLKELELIKYRGGKITLTHSGIILLRLIRNQKLEEELYELLKKEQGKIPFSLLKK